MKLRPRAEVFIFKDGKVLANLARGYVCFPGGGIDPKETPIEAAKRECLEEADRVLISCMPAHAATDQLWSERFKARYSEGHKFDGVTTHWMTGSSSRLPYHTDPRMRHGDFEPGFAWYAPETLIAKLTKWTNEDFADNVAVQLTVLRAAVAMEKEANFPSLLAASQN